MPHEERSRPNKAKPFARFCLSSSSEKAICVKTNSLRIYKDRLSRLLYFKIPSMELITKIPKDKNNNKSLLIFCFASSRLCSSIYRNKIMTIGKDSTLSPIAIHLTGVFPSLSPEKEVARYPTASRTRKNFLVLEGSHLLNADKSNAKKTREKFIVSTSSRHLRDLTNTLSRGLP